MSNDYGMSFCYGDCCNGYNGPNGHNGGGGGGGGGYATEAAPDAAAAALAAAAEAEVASFLAAADVSSNDADADADALPNDPPPPPLHPPGPPADSPARAPAGLSSGSGSGSGSGSDNEHFGALLRPAESRAHDAATEAQVAAEVGVGVGVVVEDTAVSKGALESGRREKEEGEGTNANTSGDKNDLDDRHHHDEPPLGDTKILPPRGVHGDRGECRGGGVGTAEETNPAAKGGSVDEPKSKARDERNCGGDEKVFAAVDIAAAAVDIAAPPPPSNAKARRGRPPRTARGAFVNGGGGNDGACANFPPPPETNATTTNTQNAAIPTPPSTLSSSPPPPPLPRARKRQRRTRRPIPEKDGFTPVHRNLTPTMSVTKTTPASPPATPSNAAAAAAAVPFRASSLSPKSMSTKTTKTTSKTTHRHLVTSDGRCRRCIEGPAFKKGHARTCPRSVHFGAPIPPDSDNDGDGNGNCNGNGGGNSGSCSISIIYENYNDDDNVRDADDNKQSKIKSDPYENNGTVPSEHSIGTNDATKLSSLPHPASASTTRRVPRQARNSGSERRLATKGRRRARKVTEKERNSGSNDENNICTVKGYGKEKDSLKDDNDDDDDDDDLRRQIEDLAHPSGVDLPPRHGDEGGTEKRRRIAGKKRKDRNEDDDEEGNGTMANQRQRRRRQLRCDEGEQRTNQRRQKDHIDEEGHGHKGQKRRIEFGDGDGDGGGGDDNDDNDDARSHLLSPLEQYKLAERRREEAMLTAEKAKKEMEDASARYEQAMECIRKLDEEMKSKADSVVDARLRDGSEWSRMYAELVSYKKEHGNILFPLSCYKSEKSDPDLRRLFHWVMKQRKTARHIASWRRLALDRIGFVYDTHEATWEARFDDLRRYKEEHGTCVVPHNYATNPRLGQWVSTQRRMRRNMNEEKAPANCTLTEERIRQLDELGFVWDAPNTAWSDRFNELLAYKAEHGTYNVPNPYPPNPPLQRWVQTQRTHYRYYMEGKSKCQLTAERIRLMEDAGFTWRQRPDWRTSYERLVRYKAEFGTCTVSEAYDKSLAKWTMNQRTEYRLMMNGHKSKIKPEHVRLLEEIGFDWVPPTKR